MSSQESLWSTLYQITSVKRQELAKQRDACKALRTELLGSAEREQNKSKRVRLLLKDAGKEVKEKDATSGRRRKRVVSFERFQTKASAQHQEILDLAGISASNVQRFLQQSKYDDSIVPEYFAAIEERFRKSLLSLEVKYEFATLFSDLVSDWSTQRLETTAESKDSVAIGRKEMHEQRKEWESLVFTPVNIDEEEIQATLEQVFGSPEAVQALNDLRNSVESLCHSLQQERTSVHEIKTTVKGLLSSDLLSDEQSEILKQVQNSPIWLSEMVDVLNLRLASIERWEWETEAMPLEMRRQLNGKYRLFMHEELTQALLLYHIGIRFTTSFARILDSFYHSDAWKKRPGVGRADQAKWDYFVRTRQSSIREKISSTFAKEYFMSLLPRQAEQGSGGYGDDALDTGRQSNLTKSVEAQQKLLHLIVAESLMADRLDEELVVVQTDFRWFGPSLSHCTISAVMNFLGFTPLWQAFFTKFLRAPMRFLQDGPNGAVQTRQCGVPMSHALSTFFGEATLFCLDFAVNEATNGKPMFRMHDDIWMWGTPKDMQDSWQTLTTLSKQLGITINEEKTGAARLTRNKDLAAKSLPNTLPVGALHWGLLSVENGGQFTINQGKIDEHIEEIKRQLSTRKSVFTWIQAYNSYMKFFSLKLCKPGNALGRGHVDDCMHTLQRINRELCASTNGNVSAYVKAMVLEKFGVEKIPDGFVFFPLAFGGLELRNPLIGLQMTREVVLEDPMVVFEEALEDELVEYRKLKKRFEENGAVNLYALPDQPTEFMSQEEFAVFRREYSVPFYQAWSELLESLDEDMVEQTAESQGLLAKLQDVKQSNGAVEEGEELYWRAVVELYGAEIRDMFGGVQVVEKGLLPMGLVALCKTKVRWDA